MVKISGIRRSFIVLAVMALMLVGLSITTSAHERREVEGEFEFVVGFMNEPAYVNQMNGIDLRISRVAGEHEADDHSHDNGDAEESDDHHSSSSPVLNSHETLNATIIFGDQTMDVDLRPVWGQEGAYTADVLPTETGTYLFRFHGEIDGVEIDETFEGGPDTFSEVESTDDLQFPSAADGTVADESDQMDAIAIAGVVAGLLGLAAGGAALYKVSNTGEPNPAQRRREQRRAQQQDKE
jgi:hypothetical protein